MIDVVLLVSPTPRDQQSIMEGLIGSSADDLTFANKHTQAQTSKRDNTNALKMNENVEENVVNVITV